MILPIVTYDDSVLRRNTTNIDKKTPELDIFINDMFDTLYKSEGVGLSANQVDQSLNMFIVHFKTDDINFKDVFINPKILDYSDDISNSMEGCLSFPGLQENVSRSNKITITYFDKDFKMQLKDFEGIIARIIQHEYDHTKGILFIDKINPLIRKMINSKLKNISNKKVFTPYKIK